MDSGPAEISKLGALARRAIISGRQNGSLASLRSKPNRNDRYKRSSYIDDDAALVAPSHHYFPDFRGTLSIHVGHLYKASAWR